jgi:hypothetical protein
MVVVLMTPCRKLLRHHPFPYQFYSNTQMDISKKELKRKEYLEQIGNAMRVIYSIIHLVPENYRSKLRDTYSLLVQIYSET